MEKIGGLNETSSLYQGDSFYQSKDNKNVISLSYDTKKTRDEMIKLSSDDALEINKFFDVVDGIIKIYQEQNILINLFHKIKYYSKSYLMYFKLSLKELSEKFKHPLLKKLFTDYFPIQYSAFTLIIAYATFASGNGKIYKNGTLEFSKEIENKFKSLKGKIFLNSEVTKLIVNNNRVTKIIINQKEIVKCDILIYTGDPNHLFTNLLDKSYLPKKLKYKFDNFNKYPIYSSFHSAYLINKKVNPFKDSIIFDIPDLKIGLKTFKRLFGYLVFYNSRYG